MFKILGAKGMIFGYSSCQRHNCLIVFPTDIATEWGITDEGKADGRNPSVMTSVNKSPTNF